MGSAKRQWFSCAGASPDALAALRDAAPAKLPEAYLRLLESSNGGEGPLPLQPLNFCLDSAEEAASNALEGTFEEFFPGLFVIGSNGGGEAIALDFRGGEPWPVVYFDMTNSDIEESVVTLAPCFEAFAPLIGLSCDEGSPD